MKRLSKNEAGFGAMGVVLVIIIIVLIGVAGWLVYKHNHKSTNSNTGNNSSISKRSDSSPHQQSEVNTADVTRLVANFYSKYKACNGDTTCELNAVKQYGTANLLSYYRPQTGKYAEDPILCAQTIPDSFDVSGVTSTSSAASGMVTEKFGSTTSDVKFTITKSGSLKLNTITCNPPAKATTVPN